MEYKKNLSANFSGTNAPHLTPIYTRNQKTTMIVDNGASENLSNGSASTSNTAASL